MARRRIDFTPEEYNYYVNWVIHAVLGLLSEADGLMQEHGSPIRSMAKKLRSHFGVPKKKVWRGLLIEPDSVPEDRLVPQDPNLHFVSFSEDKDVACWFAARDSAMSQFVRFLRPTVHGWLMETTPRKLDVLFHWSWARQFPHPRGDGTLPLWTLAAMHPSMDPRQVEWNMRTQKEVILKPLRRPVKVVSHGEADCPDTDELDRRLTMPGFLGNPGERRLRELERAADSGDAQARGLLAIERLRRGTASLEDEIWATSPERLAAGAQHLIEGWERDVRRRNLRGSTWNETKFMEAALALGVLSSQWLRRYEDAVRCKRLVWGAARRGEYLDDLEEYDCRLPNVQENPADDGRYEFVHACPGSTAEDIHLLRESERQITRRTFARKLAPGQWEWIQKEFGYDRHLPISQADWQIPYYKGVYRGVPAVFLEWSGFEYIFTLDGRMGPSADPGFVNTDLRARPGKPGRYSLNPTDNFDYYHGTPKWRLKEIRERGLIYPFLSSDAEQARCWGGHYATDPRSRRVLGIEQLPDPDLLVPDFNLMDPYDRQKALGVHPEEYFDVRGEFDKPEWLLEGARRYGQQSVYDNECGGEASIYLGTIPWENVKVVRPHRWNPDVRTRELERRFRKSGLLEDEVAWLAARVREGSVRPVYEILSCLRDPTAMALVGRCQAEWKHSDMFSANSDLTARAGPTYAVLMGYTAVGLLLPIAYNEVERRALLWVLEQAREWLRGNRCGLHRGSYAEQSPDYVAIEASFAESSSVYYQPSRYAQVAALNLLKLIWEAHADLRDYPDTLWVVSSSVLNSLSLAASNSPYRLDYKEALVSASRGALKAWVSSGTPDVWEPRPLVEEGRS